MAEEGDGPTAISVYLAAMEQAVSSGSKREALAILEGVGWPRDLAHEAVALIWHESRVDRSLYDEAGPGNP